MNTLFASSFQDVGDTLPLLISSLPSSPLTISSDEVLVSLKRLRNKSPGSDGLPAWLFRDFAEFLAPAVSFLFQWSLRDGKVPVCFKRANVTPVPKCSPAMNPSDYRPILLLPILSKVLEKIVARKWILPTISSRIHSSQFAYLPGEGKGTISALTLMHHDIVRFLDSSGCVRLLSIDFAKAFDKVLHSGVIGAMMKFNLPQEAVMWVSDFLSNRLQRVKVRNQVSSWCPVLSGVPQWSVLGPIFFCMFIDGLHSVCQNSTTYKYADDVHIAHFIRNDGDDRLQEEFDNVMRWSLVNRLPINETKCRVLSIVTKKSLTVNPIVAPGLILPEVPSLRVLGVTFSDYLKWNTHIDNVLKKARKRIYLISNLKRARCPQYSLTLAYNSIIRPILLYAYPCFCNIPVYLQEKLLRFEKRIFRIIGIHSNTSIIDAGENSCKTLFSKISKFRNHCLRRCFVQRSTVTRMSNHLRPIRAKGVRLSRSFIRFAR